MRDRMNLSLTCAKCGNDRFSFPMNGTDSSIVTCKSCRRTIGTMGEIKAWLTKAIAGSDDLVGASDERHLEVAKGERDYRKGSA